VRVYGPTFGLPEPTRGHNSPFYGTADGPLDPPKSLIGEEALEGGELFPFKNDFHRDHKIILEFLMVFI